MRYEEHAPPPAVAHYVACLWTLTGSGPTRPHFDLILPDGRPELVVHRGDPFRRRLSSGRTQRQARRLVVGQMTGGVALAPARRIDSLGIRFSPAGLSPLCPFPQAALADRIVSITRLPAPALRTLCAAAAAAPSTRAAIAALGRELPLVYAAAPPVEPRILAAVSANSEADGAITMTELSRVTGAPSRWLERRFQAAVGVTPKRLARLTRFRRVLSALNGDPRRAGVEVALAHGYYDQAHLIADFKAVAGDAPRRFVEARLAELTRYFVDRESGRDARASEISKTAGLAVTDTRRGGRR